MLKSIFCFSICLCMFMFTLPSFADLTLQDLKDIRLIIKEEIAKELAPIKADIAVLKNRCSNFKNRCSNFKNRCSNFKRGGCGIRYTYNRS